MIITARTRSTCTTTTNVASAWKLIEVAAISATPPGAMANKEVVSGIFVHFEMRKAQITMTNSIMKDVTLPTRAADLTSSNRCLLILVPMLVPIDTWAAQKSASVHQECRSCSNQTEMAV